MILLTRPSLYLLSAMRVFGIRRGSTLNYIDSKRVRPFFTPDQWKKYHDGNKIVSFKKKSRIDSPENFILNMPPALAGYEKDYIPDHLRINYNPAVPLDALRHRQLTIQYSKKNNTVQLQNKTKKFDETDEMHRKRIQEQKGKEYKRILAITNRTYGTYSETQEFIDAFATSGGDINQIAANLAANEIVDRYFGLRAKALKKYVYSQEWYKLPIGLDALNTIVNGFLTQGK